MNEYEPDPLPTDMDGDVHVAYSKLLRERDRYKAALEKMLIPGSGLMCTCGVCYICIAAEALRLSEIKDKTNEKA